MRARTYSLAAGVGFGVLGLAGLLTAAAAAASPEMATGLASPAASAVWLALACLLGWRIGRPAGGWHRLAHAATALATIGLVAIVQAVVTAAAPANDPLPTPVSERPDPLIDRFRPMLLLDSRDPIGPVDVDALLADDSTRSCRRRALRPDTCRLVGDPPVLDPLAHRLSLDPDAARGVTGSIYADVQRREGATYIGYWWFLAENDGPSPLESLCLVALAVREWTCFDHHGDWEGVTVVLNSREQPVSVAYQAHRSTRVVSWAMLEDAGRVTGERPHVYVAAGSHASYPEPCASRCRRIGGGPSEGSHDGGHPWTGNAGSARRLPLTRDGRPASWSAFTGRWGGRRCGLPGVCAGSDGPLGPAFQSRYQEPWRLRDSAG